MPPVRKYAGPRRPGEHSAKVTKTKTFRYKKGTKIGAKRRATRGTMNTIRLTTLSRKQENVSISYREEYDFTQMGYDAGSSPTMLRVSLNDPVLGGENPTTNNRIVAVMSGLKSGSTDPSFTRKSYNQAANLQSRLSEYFDEYRTAVVTSAEVTFSVRPKLNQVNPSDNGTVSIVPYFTNDSTGLDPTGAAGLRGPTQQTRWIGANATGDLYVWCIRQGAQQQLYDNTNGVYPLSTLKQGVPGMRMTKLNITPNSTRGCRFKMKYTPRSQFQIKDWKDNKKLLQCVIADAQQSDFKPAWCYLGVGACINGSDPSGTAGGMYMANLVIEVNVKYNINFSERKNIEGNNEPIPHRSEL